MLNVQTITKIRHTQYGDINVPLTHEVADTPVIEAKATIWTPRGWAVVDVVATNPYTGEGQAAYCFSTNPKKVWGDWFTLEMLRAV